MQFIDLFIKIVKSNHVNVFSLQNHENIFYFYLSKASHMKIILLVFLNLIQIKVSD